jgi:hypothetical protein
VREEKRNGKRKRKGEGESRAGAAMVAVALDGRASAGVIFLLGAQPPARDRTERGRDRVTLGFGRFGSF